MFDIEFAGLVKAHLDIPTVDWGVNEEGVFFPAAVMTMATQIREHSMSGSVALKKSIVRVDIWSEDISECVELAEKLNAIDGYLGGPDEKISVINLETMSHPKPHTAKDFVTHVVSVDFYVWHY